MDEELGDKLDDTILEFFATLTELYKVNGLLEEVMKSGFFNMSRARYSMGSKSVGALQFNDNMTANCKVNLDTDISHTKDDDFVFEITKGDNTLELQTERTDTVVRRRNVSTPVSQKADCEDNEKTEDIVTKLKDVDLTDSSPRPRSPNPITWFGVLVPASLRQSQTDFKQAVHYVVDLANLRKKLVALKLKYKKLEKMKLQTL